MPTATKKKCSRCGRKMSVKKFYPSKSTKSGYRSECKVCGKESR